MKTLFNLNIVGYTHVIMTLLAQVKVDHCGDGMDGNQKLTFFFTHFAELVEQSKVLCEMFQMLFGSMFHLKIKKI